MHSRILLILPPAPPPPKPPHSSPLICNPTSTSVQVAEASLSINASIALIGGNCLRFAIPDGSGHKASPGCTSPLSGGTVTRTIYDDSATRAIGSTGNAVKGCSTRGGGCRIYIIAPSSTQTVPTPASGHNKRIAGGIDNETSTATTAAKGAISRRIFYVGRITPHLADQNI
jgi:hypothetical protein